MSEFKIKAPKGSTKRRRILGRGQGNGRGGTAGKGHKGQNARAGGGVRPGFEGGQMPLFRRIARKGFSNYPFKEAYDVVNVKDLEKLYTDNELVNKESLVKKGLIKSTKLLTKLLGDGELTKKLTVELDKVSASAKEKITKAGGEVKNRAASTETDTSEAKGKKNKGKNKTE